MGNIIHLQRRFAALWLASSRAEAMFATASRTRMTRLAKVSTAVVTSHRRCSKRLESHTRADVYICGPTRFMADMKEVLAGLGVAPERIHVEIFNGSESMTPGVVKATA